MRILGLDFGAKRIGLALSDPDARFSFPAGALERRGRKHDLAALRELVAEQQVGAIVMGLPIHMDGRSGPEVQAARDFGAALEAATDLRVEWIDERWTSLEAERTLREAGRRARTRRGPKGRKRAKHPKGEVDAIAASIILRTWLERRANADRTQKAAE
jgi:putative Holliday junction resolvase